MSLLTPERVPVKVYRWDDADAPALDKTPNCMATIFKACLVTGYGTKEGAGWTMPFEDTAAGVKVLRPEVGPHTDFYLRLSADTGTEMAAQVYLNMTDANTGDLKLEGSRPFAYAKASISNKWILIATPRGMFFSCEQSVKGGLDKKGAYFYVGDSKPGPQAFRSVAIQHTGGTSSDFSDILGNRASGLYKDVAGYVYGKAMRGQSLVVDTISFSSLFNGETVLTNHEYSSPVFFVANNDISILPGLAVPSCGAKDPNYTTKLIEIDGFVTNVIVVGTGSYTDMNLYVSTDFWSY